VVGMFTQITIQKLYIDKMKGRDNNKVTRLTSLLVLSALFGLDLVSFSLTILERTAEANGVAILDATMSIPTVAIMATSANIVF
jgi:hypothetical protein